MSSINSYISHLVDVARDAAASGAYLYPIRGISYFVGHPSLYPPLTSRILPCTLLTLGVTIAMFVFTYVPQAAVLTFVNGPLGPINAVALVLSESTTVVTLLARSFLLQGALTELFDATLLSAGQEQLVARGRELKDTRNGRSGVHRLGREVMKPLNKFSPGQFIQYLALLPLNLIPVVGTVAFIIAQGRKSGPGFHTRYYQLKGVTGDRKEEEIKRRRGSYIAFGTAAMALNLIPFTSIFFTFTSTVGAALWAADLEKGIDKPQE